MASHQKVVNDTILNAIRKTTETSFNPGDTINVEVRPQLADAAAQDVLLPRTRHGGVMVQLLLMAFNQLDDMTV